MEEVAFADASSSLISAPGEAWLQSLGHPLKSIPALARHHSPGHFTIPGIRFPRSVSLPLLAWRHNRWLFSTRISDTLSYFEAQDGSARLDLERCQMPATLVAAIPSLKPPLETMLAIKAPIFAGLRARIVDATDCGLVIFLRLEIGWHPAPSPFPRPQRHHLIALKE